VIAVIGAKLKKYKSPYADIFTSIEVLSNIKADSEKLKTALREAHKDPKTLEELDQQWKEAEVFTGDPLTDVAANSGTCNAFPNTMEVVNKITGSKK
jgi:ubiquinone biosynthesis protein Coq4